jgi:hypothetical protein
MEAQMSRLVMLSAALGAALLMFTETAGATPVTIFSDFGPGNSYTSGIGWTVAGPAGAGGSFQSVAMPFTPSGDYQLSQIDIALGFASGTNSAMVTLNSDSSGIPGGVLMTWNLSSLPAFGTCCVVETLAPSSPLLLSSGTRYWVVANPGSSDTHDAWNFNDMGATGLVMLNNGNGFFIAPHSELGAFDVLAEVATSVPEPPTALLTAGGIAWLSRRVPRRSVRRAPAHALPVLPSRY